MNAAPLTPLRDFSDRLSPMLVKELRHGLRTRIFTSLLTTFQVCMILIVGTGILGVEAKVIGNVFWSVALLALFVALPLRGFGILSGEVQGGTMDMLTLTSMSAFRIVWGKWSALFSQTLLLACSLLPYLVARYQFGGVEIVRELIALTVAVLGSALATAAFVAFSSQRSLVIRLLLTIGIFIALLPITSFTFVMINDTGGDAVMRSLMSLSGLEQTGIIAGIFCLVAYSIFTFLSLGASRIASVSENHSSWKRVIHLGMMTLLTLIGFALSFHPAKEAFFWVFVPAMYLTLLIGLDVTTEEMPRYPSVMWKGKYRQIQGRLFYPGWASGVMFYILLGVMCLSTLMVYWSQHPGNSFDEFVIVMACFLLSMVLPVCLRPNKTNRFVNWWLVQIVLLLMGIILMMFMGISDNRDLGSLGVLTPITGMLGATDNYRHGDEIMMTTMVFGCCWLLAAMVLAAHESKLYAQLEREAEKLTPSLPQTLES